jgi:hypothetical protein
MSEPAIEQPEQLPALSQIRKTNALDHVFFHVGCIVITP